MSEMIRPAVKGALAGGLVLFVWGVISLLLARAGVASYWGRVGFVVVLLLAAGVLCHLPNWNWWQFSDGYILTAFFDLLAGGFLAALVLARIIR